MWVTFVLSWKFYSLSFISVDDTARKVKVEKMVRSELKKLDWKPIYLTAYNIRNKNVNFNIQEKAECESHVTYNMYSLVCYLCKAFVKYYNFVIVIVILFSWKGAMTIFIAIKKKMIWTVSIVHAVSIGGPLTTLVGI